MKITREVFEIGNLFSQSFKKEKVFKCVVCSCNCFFLTEASQEEKEIKR